MSLSQSIQSYRNTKSNEKKLSALTEIKHKLKQNKEKQLNLTLDDTKILVDIIFEVEDCGEFKELVITNYINEYIDEVKKVASQRFNKIDTINFLLEHYSNIENILKNFKISKEMQINLNVAIAEVYYKKIFAQDKWSGFLSDVKNTLKFLNNVINLAGSAGKKYQENLEDKWRRLWFKLEGVISDNRITLAEKTEAQQIILEMLEKPSERKNDEALTKAYDKFFSLIKDKIFTEKKKIGKEWFLDSQLLSAYQLRFDYCKKAYILNENKYYAEYLRAEYSLAEILEYSDRQAAASLYKDVVQCLNKKQINDEGFVTLAYKNFGMCILKSLPTFSNLILEEKEALLVDLKDAIASLKKVIEILDDKNSKYMLITAFTQLGTLYGDMSDKANSEECFAEAIQLALTFNELKARAVAEKRYANFLEHYDKDKELALQYYFQAYHHLYLYAEENKFLDRKDHHQYQFFRETFKKSYKDTTPFNSLKREYASLYDRGEPNNKRAKRDSSLENNKREEDNSTSAQPRVK